MSLKTIVIVIDAFRHDYLCEENTPFLHSLTQKGRYYKKLEPSFGFCERTEILVGEESSDLGYFTAIGFNPEQSPYKKLRPVLRLISPVFIRLPLLGQRIVKRLVWEYMSRQKNGFPPLTIPLDQLPYFALTEDGAKSAITDDPRSILNLVKGKGGSVNMESFTSLDSRLVGDDEYRCNKLLENIEADDDLYLLYVGDCDKFGHVLGPESGEFKKELKIVDERLRLLYSQIKDKVGDTNFIFCGDHGMTSVTSTIDLIGEIKSYLTGFEYGKDYLIFADSTVFRVWALNPVIEDELSLRVEQFFGQSSLCDLGRLTTPEKEGISSPRQYGDWLWVAKKGVVISPDFFNPETKIIKGMHGYELHECSYGMAICDGPAFTPDTVKEEKLTVLYSAINSSLNFE
mgnify:CR=1 FL=1